MKKVGPSIFFGIFLTKIIGISVLLAAPSYVFKIYYFRMLIMIIIIGFIHGFVFLPIFLTVFNIKGQAKVEEKEKIAEAVVVVEN